MKKESYSAFPSGDNRVQFSGMSLRDYFAAQAMQSLINKDHWQSTVGDIARQTAADAYFMADVMLEERE